MMTNPNHNFKKGNYLVNAYQYVKKESALNLKNLDFYWKGYQEFNKIRSGIAHKRYDIIVSKDYLLENLSDVHTLLRTIADAIYMKDFIGGLPFSEDY